MQRVLNCRMACLSVMAAWLVVSLFCLEETFLRAEDAPAAPAVVPVTAADTDTATPPAATDAPGRNAAEASGSGTESGASVPATTAPATAVPETTTPEAPVVEQKPVEQKPADAKPVSPGTTPPAAAGSPRSKPTGSRRSDSGVVAEFAPATPVKSNGKPVVDGKLSPASSPSAAGNSQTGTDNGAAAPIAAPVVTVPPSRKAVAPPDSTPAATSIKEAKVEPAAPPADKPASEGKQLSFNFRFAPWEMVLKRFSQEAGLTLDMGEVPPGTFNYYDTGSYSPTEALDILNGYLLQKGYVLVRRDRFLVVVNLDHGIPPNLIPQVTIAELPERGRNELLSVIMPLTDADAKTVAEEVKALLGPQGKVVPLTKVNRILVTDIGSNLQRIHELLTGLGAIEETKGTVFQSFKLKYISATDAERMMRDLFHLPARGSSTSSTSAAAAALAALQNSSRRGGDFRRSRGRRSWGGGGDWGGWGRGRGDDDERRDENQGSEGDSQQNPQASASKLQFTPDLRTNSLLVTGSAEELQLVDQAIKTIDVVESAGNHSHFSRSSNVPQLEVYALESADPQIVVDVLNSTVPGLMIHADTRTRRLNIYATPADQQTVRNIIRQIDEGAGDSVAVIQLHKLEATAAAASLRSLFSEGRDSSPSIEADSAGRRLMVRGTPDQVAQIKRMLVELDGAGPEGLADRGPRGPYRTISPGGRSAEEIISLVQRLVSDDQRTFIRVVPPSAIAPPSFRLRDVEEKSPTGASFIRKVPRSERPPADRQQTEPEPKKHPLREAAPAEARPEKRSPASNDGVPAKEASLLKQIEAGEEAPGSDKTVADKTVADAAAGTKTVRTATVDDQTVDSPENGDRKRDRQSPSSGAESRSPADSSGPDASRPGEVRIGTFGGNILLYSDDQQALDRIERLIQTVVQSASTKTKWTVYYLRVADATETASMLSLLFPQGSVTQTSSSRSSSYFGGFSDSMGLSSLGSDGTALRIVPEVRSNALFITGPTGQVDQVLEALNVLDSAEIPESLKDRVPRLIDVEHANVEDVATVVREVFREQLESQSAAPQMQMGGGRGGRGGFNALAMLMAGSQGGAANRGVELSIGVDTRTNTLVVSASEQLFRQVEALVESLDEAADEANRTVRVVTLENADSLVVQQALGSLLGKVHVSSTGTERPSSSSSSSSQNSRGSSQADQLRSYFEQRMRDRGGDSRRSRGDRDRGGDSRRRSRDGDRGGDSSRRRRSRGDR